jgi:hypothetical protein
MLAYSSAGLLLCREQPSVSSTKLVVMYLDNAGLGSRQATHSPRHTLPPESSLQVAGQCENEDPLARSDADVTVETDHLDSYQI